MEIPIFGLTTVTLTVWKCVGLAGALMFSARWFVHMWHRNRTKTAEVPTVFWIMSLIGASLTSAYFIFGKNDSVGIIQNVMPMSVAGWNLWMDLNHRRQRLAAATVSQGEPPQV